MLYGGLPKCAKFTDQKESTRLGMEWEWVTKVSVVKEGKFTLIDWDEIDEAEIFEGNENTLTMAQKKTLGSSSASTRCKTIHLTPRS